MVLPDAHLEVAFETGDEAVESGAYIDITAFLELYLAKCPYLDTLILVVLYAEAVDSLDRHNA